MATHSSVLAWRIPGTAEPGGLPSMGSHGIRHDWSDLVEQALRTKTSDLSVLTWALGFHLSDERTLDAACSHLSSYTVASVNISFGITPVLPSFKLPHSHSSGICLAGWIWLLKWFRKSDFKGARNYMRSMASISKFKMPAPPEMEVWIFHDI